MTQLQYKSRVGASSTSPLLFLVHGRAGNIDVMSTFVRSVPESWHIVFVEAPVSDPIGGFSWWDINSTAKEAQRQASLELLSDFIVTYKSMHSINPETQLAFGFSQGGAMLSLIVQRSPDLLDGIAILSGLILKEANVAQGKKPKIFIAHGTLDEVVPLERLTPAIQDLQNYGYQIELITEEVAHKVGIQGMRALRAWVNSNFLSISE